MSCEICAFKNPKNTATAIVVRDGKLLVAKRNKEPQKGKWDFVGGFLNEGETPEEGLRREAKEELGIDIERLEFIGNFSGEYSYNDQTFPIVDSAYFVEFSGEPKLSSENSELAWLPPHKIDIAFPSLEKILSRVKEMVLSYQEVKELVKQLDPSAEIDEFKIYAAQLNGYVSKKYDGGKLVGLGWIFPRQTLLRKQAVIEDMIVDESQRGKGYGKEIVLDLIRWAKENGVEVIELTSNPKRVAANELYKKVGFKLHPTNHYLLDLR